MFHVDSDTLAYYKLNPFLNATDFSSVRLKDLVPHIQDSTNNMGLARPEGCAVEFYLTNHAYSLVASRFEPHEPLGEMKKVCEVYAAKAELLFRRLIHYMILITTRESRHAQNHSTLHKALQEEFGSEYMQFHLRIRGSGSSTAVAELLSNPPDMTLGEYTKALVYTFYKGKYSTSYGGPVWGKIADAVKMVVHGEISPEMLVDTAWTLSHNTGPIFNKGMLFYQQNNPLLLKILDVQRSGQIPQLLNEAPGLLEPYGVDMALFNALKALLPADMDGEVDWFKVEALGALGSYHQEKQAQTKKHGAPPKVEEPPKPEIQGKKIQITPTCYAVAVKRAA